MNSQIEINIIFSQYEKNSFEGFNRDLLELAIKWKLQTKTTSFAVTQLEVKDEHKVKRLKRKAKSDESY
jgi:hypothetical protein